ncbi:molybdate ABC transporter permease subunit [Commensalibacter communis]|uniref:Molybdenum transport system permease n=1 Tax=Commensalibacter communis TaxID=2972786 RepID=A0A9W4TPE2_9PROT|nr:molybdate ABC transporter permease subunit [Commensalibacter communis]CAI3936216.1 ABC-type molybdate transport system [Commensalibacter communis]CAI3938142.1 ABC-type molybdate transport system [Commensalibacter communis]CAI3942010.1 ABC-type molybdate transport system [Commensalibacter communis]CAI3942198.1 ABC-type molybdate transport system [Commensalibacter communis]CAI3944445.1 ABC-type molybdate transport system [Commensalibacter communis]
MMNFSWDALFLSLKVAGCSVIINLVITVPIGFLFARKKFIGKEFLDTILTLPMVLPPTVLGYYLLVLLGRHGWIGQCLEKYFNINLIFTWQAAVVAATIVTFPLVFKPTRTAFESVNVCYEQAASVLGISNFSIFFRIILPLAWRGIFAGLLLSFARALGEFGATLMVAGSIPGKTETLSIAIYQAVQEGDNDTASIAVIILSIVCIAVLVVAKKLTGYKIFH